MTTTAIAIPRLLTAADLLALPDDGRRRQLIRGELIEMPPASDEHGLLGDEMGWRIGGFIRQRRLGRGRASETGFRIAPDTVLAPDYAYISYARMPTPPRPQGYAEATPDLVVEVFSPHDRHPALDDKIRIWLDAGVRLVLAVYPQTQEIHAHHDDGAVRRFGLGDTLTCEPVLPGFACPVADIFTY